MKQRSLSLSLSLYVSLPLSISSHLHTCSIPATEDYKGVLFQSQPLPPPVEGVQLRFKTRWGELLRPRSPCTTPPPSCRLPPWTHPFDGVMTAACITWVTAGGTQSQLMKP